MHISLYRLRLLTACCFFLMLAALFIGGHQPGSGNLFPPPWDKLVHFAFYGVITILAAIAFPKIPIPWLGLMIVGIGGADEIHQIFVPGRHVGLDDLAADVVGCFPALFLVSWFYAKLELYLNQ